jgi:HlyD family secretion protein
VAVRRIFYILGALLLGAVVIFILRSRNERQEIGPTVKAERGRIERVVVASGTIEPEQMIEVRPRISGIVEEFLVEAGDRVRAGDVVARIERQTLEAAVREARAVVKEAEVARDLSARDLDRLNDLFRKGVESSERLDQVSSTHQGAVARLARAQATLDRLEQELAYATITAPIDGVVLQRDLDPGAAVASVIAVTGGTVLMSIADTSRMHLLGVVDENEIADVNVGMEARIRTETYPDRVFPGRVRKIASIGDRKENVTSFKVEVAVLEGVEALRPKMSADADIVAEVHDDALVLPETTLLYEGDDIVVEVVERSSAAALVRRPVKIGISSGDRVEILEGASAGDEVKVQ